jgi:hypothetical protein
LSSELLALKNGSTLNYSQGSFKVFYVFEVSHFVRNDSFNLESGVPKAIAHKKQHRAKK